MPRRIFNIAKEKGFWAAFWLVIFLAIGALTQDRIVSTANQHIGPWSEFIFWATWLCISLVTVYGVRALAIDYGVSAAAAGYTDQTAAKARAWWAATYGKSRTQRAAMARRWLRLSDEILAEMPRHGIGPRFHDLPGLTDEQMRALWRAETNQAIAEFQGGMERARRLFLARITQARDEMVAERVELNRRLDRAGGIFLVNTFCLQEWAATLGAEGRKILNKLGEEP